jgi:hypothetical protein
MRDDLIKAGNSDLVNVQKLEAVKKFVMPMVDFLLFSGDAFEGALNRSDEFVRGMITDWIRGKGIPTPFFHMSWRDGGLAIAELRERQDTLKTVAMCPACASWVISSSGPPLFSIPESRVLPHHRKPPDKFHGARSIFQLLGSFTERCGPHKVFRLGSVLSDLHSASSDLDPYEGLFGFSGSKVDLSESKLVRYSHLSEPEFERDSEGFRGGSETVRIVLDTKATVSSEFLKAPRTLHVHPEPRDVPDFSNSYLDDLGLNSFCSISTFSEGHRTIAKVGYLRQESEVYGDTVPICLSPVFDSTIETAETVTNCIDKGCVNCLFGALPTFPAQSCSSDNDQSEYDQVRVRVSVRVCECESAQSL